MGASAGRVLIIPKGNWNAETTYTGLDMVRHNGASWVCKNTCTNIVPSTENANYWQTVSRDGADIAVDSEVSDESTNPVQNKVIKKYVDEHTPEIADMTGATTTQNGAHGLVPAPQAGDDKKALLGDGTWGSVDAIFTYKTKEEFDAAVVSGEIPDGAKVIKEYDEGETPVIIGVDTAMSDDSTNPVQNKVVKKYVDDKKVNVDGLTITLDEARNVIKLADTLKDKIGTALQPESIANNQTTTEAGFALDARQANPDLDGTIAKQVSTMAGRLNYIYNIPETLPSFASIPGGVGIHTYCITNGEDPVTDSPYPDQKGWWNAVQFGTDGSGSLYRLTQIASQAFKKEFGFKGKDELWIRSRHDDTWSAWRMIGDFENVSKVKILQWTPQCPSTNFADKVLLQEAFAVQYGLLIICSIRIDLSERTPSEYIPIANLPKKALYGINQTNMNGKEGAWYIDKTNNCIQLRSIYDAGKYWFNFIYLADE